MNKTFSGMMPSGKVTTSANTYIRAWRTLNRKVEAALGGGHVYAFDPDLSYRRSNFETGHEIPLWMAKRIAELYDVSQGASP